jgi:hypothetical protein
VSGRSHHRNRRRARRLFVGAAVLLGLAVVLTGARFYLPVMADATSVTVRLKERNQSGVSGRARLEAADGVTWIRISVNGPDLEYLPYLHHGTCKEYREALAIPLSLVAPNRPGETAIDIPLDELLSGGYVIDLHTVDLDVETLFDPATSVACGVVGKPKAPPPAGGTTEEVQPPITGVGPIQGGRDWAMLTAAALGAASFLFAMAGMREQRHVAQGFTTVDVVNIRRLQGLPQ